MPINQPPIIDDVVLSSWHYEVTNLVNELETIVQRNRASRGPDFPPSPELGAEHYLTEDIAGTEFTTGWHKYDTTDGWIEIGG